MNPFTNLAQLDRRHLLLTPRNIALRRTFPWAYSVQKILHAVRPVQFPGTHLFVGSDYGGDHKASKYKTYAFVVVNDAPSPWLSMQRRIRAYYLENARRMSFKRLGDPQRQEALVPFLQAADTLNGHLVVFAVHKSVHLHPCKKEDIQQWKQLFELSANWNHRAFEAAFRKTHFFSLLVGQWSRPSMDVTWISDQDEFVANEARLDDAQRLAARLSTLYLPHSLRVFAMNTTKVDGPQLEFEDLLAIPDLAAGMLSELSSALAKGISWSDIDGRKPLYDGDIQPKSELLVDWFWHADASLRRTCIVIDKIGIKTRVFKLDQLSG